MIPLALAASEVVEMFNDATDGGDVKATKNEFKSFNEQRCPLVQK
ncbi:hypothetical protein [Fodinibius sp. AD559]